MKYSLAIFMALLLAQLGQVPVNAQFYNESTQRGGFMRWVGGTPSGMGIDRTPCGQSFQEDGSCPCERAAQEQARQQMLIHAAVGNDGTGLDCNPYMAQYYLMGITERERDLALLAEQLPHRRNQLPHYQPITARGYTDVFFNRATAERVYGKRLDIQKQQQQEWISNMTFPQEQPGEELPDEEINECPRPNNPNSVMCVNK